MRLSLTLGAALVAVSLAAPAAADPDDPAALIPPDGSSASHVQHSAGGTLHIARRYIGGNPTGRRYLWCADFVNHVERRAGRPGTGNRSSLGFRSYGTRIARGRARPGDIVVLSRRGGGHVGYFVRYVDGGRRVVLISGNTGGRRGARVVGEGRYDAGRIVAIVRPPRGGSI